jgi:transposase
MRTAEGLRPPLANDLFQQALQHKMLGADGRRHLQELFDYIERYWKLSVDSLRERSFDIEACFTILQQQQIEHADTLHVGYLAQVEDQLAALLARFIGHVQNYMAPDTAPDLLELGRRLLEERPAVLTFNYDTIIESVIESASGLSDLPEPAEGWVPDDKLSYSWHNWNRALAYGVLFDEVELQQTGTLLEPVPRERFYGHPGNSLYDPPILKLHGSLNWLTHTESGCILPSMSEKRSLEESESTRLLEGLYRKASDPVLRTHLLMVWRMSLGDPIREVARMVGYSEKWTREIARRYEREGVEGLGDRRHGNPGAKQRALLDEEGQAELREALLEGSPPGGGMWSGPKVARWIEHKRGLEKVHAQRGWEYMRSVRMSPQVPRPSNAQGAESEEREAFKKISPSG